MNEQAEICVHEAGHSVVALALGLRVDRTTIVADSSAKGRSWWNGDGSIKDALASLGGRAASEILLGRASAHGCRFDDDRTLRQLAAAGFRDSAGVRQALLGEARALIERHRGAVALVAVALLDRGTLEAGEIAALLRRAS